MQLVKDELDDETEYAYDGEGNLKSVVDARENETKYGYDEDNRLILVTDALLNDTAYEYDDVGQLITITDALLHETHYEYDIMGHLTYTKDAEDREYTNSFKGGLNSGGGLSGREWSYEYDANGRLKTATDPLNNSTNYGYDEAGNLETVTDALSHTTTYGYDERNRLVSVTDELDNTTEFEYDDANNKISVNDPLDHKTLYDYDERNQLKTITDALSGETSFTYDLNGNLKTLTDPEDNTTTWTYDELNRVETETNELGKTRSYEYDEVRNLKQKTDRNDRVTKFEYDEVNQLRHEEWMDSVPAVIKDFEYTYNEVGWLMSVDDGDSTYAMDYNDVGQLKSVSNAGSTDMPTYELTYSYDGNGDLESTDNVGNLWEYDHDALGRVKEIDMTIDGQTVTPTVELDYDKVGNLKTITRSGGAKTATIETTYEYDEVNRIKSIDHMADTVSLASYDYEWDEASRLTQEISVDGTEDYEYDDTNQITVASGWRNESYTYDKNGNRDNYTIGDDNRIESDGTYNYDYDDEGNMITKTDISTGDYWSYDWDYRNRLISVTKYDSGDHVLEVSQFTYDAFDRLIIRSFDDDGPGVHDPEILKTTYDGDNPAVDFDSNNDLQTSYLYGPAIDMILARIASNGDLGWYVTDHQGTVRDIVDDQGTNIDHIQFGSFGVILNEDTPINGDRFKFTAREFDANLQVHNYRARMYNQSTGSFLSSDPSGFESNDQNLTRYVANMPTIYTDPTGLFLDWRFWRRRPPSRGGGRTPPQPPPGESGNIPKTKPPIDNNQRPGDSGFGFIPVYPDKEPPPGSDPHAPPPVKLLPPVPDVPPVKLLPPVPDPEHPPEQKKLPPGFGGGAPPVKPKDAPDPRWKVGPPHNVPAWPGKTPPKDIQKLIDEGHIPNDPNWQNWTDKQKKYWYDEYKGSIPRH